MALEVMRTEVASMVDFDFVPFDDRTIPDEWSPILEQLPRDRDHVHGDARVETTAGQYSEMLRASLEVGYRESESWIWYQNPRSIEAPLQHGRHRVCFGPNEGGPEEALGASVLLIPRRGVGVATAWVKGIRDDPWRRKDQLWHDPEYLWELFDPTGLADVGVLSRVERHYPFLSVQVDTSDLDAFCVEHVPAVGAWLTGGYDQYSEIHLQEMLARNLSARRYERFFVRWTDALALYDSGTIDDAQVLEELRTGEEPLDEKYELTKLRAAQVFEYCILARRLFRNDAFEISRLATSVSLLTAPVVSGTWRAANAVLTRFSEAELEIVTAPPLLSSVEAGDLVTAAVGAFGVTKLVTDTRRSYELLDRRLQWVRGQWLAVVAVMAFVVNAVLAFAK